MQQIWGKTGFLMMVQQAWGLILLSWMVACGPQHHGGHPPTAYDMVAEDTLAATPNSSPTTEAAKLDAAMALLAHQAYVKPQIAAWPSLSFSWGAGKSFPRDGMMGFGKALRKDLGRQKILRWMAAAIKASSPAIRPEDQWAQEEDLVTFPAFESRWAKEFNDEYQRASGLAAAGQNYDLKVHTVFTFAPFRNGPVLAGEEDATPHLEQTLPENSSRRLPRSFNRLLEVTMQLIAYHPEKGTRRLLQTFPPATIHHGALEVQTTLNLDVVPLAAALENHELLGLQVADYNLTPQISYQQWKQWRQENLALVVISTPRNTYPYYVKPEESLAEVLTRYDAQAEFSGQQVLKFAGQLVRATNTIPTGLGPGISLAPHGQDYIFYSSHALATPLKAGESYYVALATMPEVQNAARAWSPWQEHEVRFTLGARELSERTALRFDRPLEKGDLLEIELLRESEFIDAAAQEYYFKHRYQSGPDSTSNYINSLEALDAMALSWEIGDRRFPLEECHVAGSKVYYYDFWQILSGGEQTEMPPAGVKLHHAQAFIDWEVDHNSNLPIALYWHHSALLEQSLSRLIKAVKIKVRGRVWQRQR
ncbi:MAG: hypothetical protein J6Y94_02765 [Bacteriovoracaceae bacterium]|nr:hypothetical protein [Bacteriovoracaceae bacterium]